jgi:putative addiction module component (TIGR02574 family)
MTPKALRDEILRLSANERLQLVEEIWDSLAAEPDSIPVPDWHKAELDRRLDNPAPGPGESWEEVRARLRKQ